VPWHSPLFLYPFKPMMLAKPLPKTFRLLTAVALGFAAPFGATGTALAAQAAPVPHPVALTKVDLVSESPTESHFQLTLQPTANPFQALANDPRDPALALALATRSSSAAAPRGLNGLVRSIQFVQAEGVLVLHFLVNTNATITASRNGDQMIDVVVSSGTARSQSADAGTVANPAGPAQFYGPPEGQGGYQLVLLKYADVSEVVGLLTDATTKSNDVFIPEEPSFGSNSLTGSTYTPQPASPAPGTTDQPLGESINASIAIDRRLNAIWLRGSPDEIARLKAMIAMIDIPVDSVILETQMVELTESGSKDLGIDFTNANGQLGVATFQSGQFIPPGIPTGNHLSSVQFQAALYAEIQKGNGRIVSKPRIAAQSGSTAKIITGDALPILTAITLSGVNGVSQQVQYVNVGVTLQIAPRVSADGFVTSHVYAVVSSVTGFSQGYPTISQRQAETSATVRDGDSFVIGGLTQDENITNKGKIPILGDIPILGEAFKTTHSTRSKTELYIIVTPHIVHRVGTQALTQARQEPYDSQPVTTIPAQGESVTYVPLQPPTDVPQGNPLDQPHQ
jgi:general secretion pathway protein D